MVHWNEGPGACVFTEIEADNSYLNDFLPPFDSTAICLGVNGEEAVHAPVVLQLLPLLLLVAEPLHDPGSPELVFLALLLHLEPGLVVRPVDVLLVVLLLGVLLVTEDALELWKFLVV